MSSLNEFCKDLNIDINDLTDEDIKRIKKTSIYIGYELRKSLNLLTDDIINNLKRLLGGS